MQTQKPKIDKPAVRELLTAGVERETGIEPACSAWEADILPLNYSRIFIIQWYLFYQIFFLKSSGAFDFFLQKGNSW